MRIVHVVRGFGVGRHERPVASLSRVLAAHGPESAIVGLTTGGDERGEANGDRGE